MTAVMSHLGATEREPLRSVAAMTPNVLGGEDEAAMGNVRSSIRLLMSSTRSAGTLLRWKQGSFVIASATASTPLLLRRLTYLNLYGCGRITGNTAWVLWLGRRRADGGLRSEGLHCLLPFFFYPTG